MVNPRVPDYKYEDCKFKVEGPIATFMFSNPRLRNSYTLKTWEGLWNACAEIRDNDDIRVLVITGDPEGKTFCGGLNVKGVYANRAGKDIQEVIGADQAEQRRRAYTATPGTFWHMAQERFASWGKIPGREDPKGRGHEGYQGYRWHTLRGGFVPERGSVLINLDKPVIAMVNGGAYGHGCDIIFYCDIICASREKAEFQWTYIHRGMVPAEGGTYLLPRITGKYRALEALWLGTSLSADQVNEWGWINHVWPDAELKQRTYELANKLATQCPPMIMGAIKYCVHAGFPGGDFGFGLLKHIDELVRPATSSYEGSEDAVEGPRSFVEKRKPKYTGR